MECLNYSVHTRITEIRERTVSLANPMQNAAIGVEAKANLYAVLKYLSG